MLAALAADRGTRTRTLRETEAEAQDPESRLFRRVLRGKSVSAQRTRGAERSSILQVAEWTHGIFENAPKPSEVRVLLARQAIKESLGGLLEGFQGRQAELRRLRRFTSAASHGRLPVMAVSGIGGSGKSTLLARFATGLLESSPRPAVVLIDFDRARFASGDPVALTFELTRQVATWFPAIAEPLRKLRHDARLNLLSSAFSRPDQMETSGLEAVGRSTSEVNYLLGGILTGAKVGVSGGRPLVVVLDTFEVLQGGRGEGSGSYGTRGIQAVAEWAEDLFSIAGLNELKLVVAGRAPIEEDPTFGPRLTEPELRLTGLDPPSAIALLHDLGLRADDARAVVEAVGDPADGSCNPLILRLASRLVKAGTVRAKTLAEEAGSGRQALDQELVQGILYRRILAHISDREKDKALAALAHPGLVLRRVTPDLIEHVLFPVLKVGEGGPARARELFGRLRREVWLVQEAGPDAVTHRTDLRRAMLRLIDVDMRKKVRRIHRAASKFYEAGRDAGLSAELAAGEAFYHRLMLMTPAQAARLDSAQVRGFESSLNLTLDDLPPHVLAVVKLILDRPLSDEDGKNLPEPRRTEFILRQGERHLLNDEPYRALQLLAAKPELHPVWELRALAVTASWPLAKKRGLLSLPDPSSAEESLYERANLVIWARFCLGSSRRAFEDARTFLQGRYLSRGSWAAFPSRVLKRLARCVTYRMVAARDAGSQARKEARYALQGVPWSELSHEDLGTTSMALEATRHAILYERGGDWEPRVVFSGEALPPSIPLLTRLVAADLPTDLTRMLRDLQKRLRALPKYASSGHILGTIARGFPKAFVVGPAHWKEGKPPWTVGLPTPEFRGPIKFALLEAFTTEKELWRIAEVAWSLFDLRPQDLRPEVFAKTASRPGKAGSEVANLVLYLDRSTVLGRFLKQVQRLKPRAVKLAMVTDAFERWERAFAPAPLLPPRRRPTSGSKLKSKLKPKGKLK